MLDTYMLEGGVVRRCVPGEHPNMGPIVHTKLPGVALLSTTFLGIDHGYSTVGTPVLFETMFFWEPQFGFLDEWQERDTSFPRALARHRRLLRQWAKATAVFDGQMGALEAAVRLGDARLPPWLT